MAALEVENWQKENNRKGLGRLGNRWIHHVDTCICIQHPSNVSMRCLIKGVAIAGPDSSVHHNVVSHSTLLGSWSLYRRQPHPFLRQPLVRQSLYRLRALPDIWNIALSLSSRTPGLVFIPIFRVRRCEGRTVVLKDGYGIHCCHSSSIAFHCLFVYWCPRTFWLGQ